MNMVSRSQLRITIYNIIYEEKQNEHYEEENRIVTKTDVMDFIDSNPYFDEMLKIFLKDKFIEDVDAMVVSERWKEEFAKRVYEWTKKFYIVTY